MKNFSDIPTWLYIPIKAMLLIVFALPFVLWGVQLNRVMRDAETAMADRASHEVKSVEKQCVGLVASPKQGVATVEKENSAAADAGYVMGIDVSHYQGVVRWDKVAKTGIKFAFAKATGGASFVDPDFANNWQAMREVELYRGAYHFFLANDDPKEQAGNFIRTINKLNDNDLPPMLDVETADHTNINTLTDRVFVWLQLVEKSTGRLPIIYTDNGFADKILSDPRFSRYPLWIADYAGKVSDLPNPWEKRGWQFWQFEENGKVAGIEGEVDIDKFKGTLTDLIAFIDKSRVR